MMTITSLMTFIFSLLALMTVVAAAPLSTRDVFVPPVIYPRDGTVWKAGERHNVTWDASRPPKQITNKIGQIVLAKAGLLLDYEHPLASGFDILSGRQEITIPADAKPGDDYTIVLFGDSGNNSGRFTIAN